MLGLLITGQLSHEWAGAPGPGQNRSLEAGTPEYTTVIAGLWNDLQSELGHAPVTLEAPFQRTVDKVLGDAKKVMAAVSASQVTWVTWAS